MWPLDNASLPLYPTAWQLSRDVQTDPGYRDTATVLRDTIKGILVYAG
jgi:hypothetical protein